DEAGGDQEPGLAVAEVPRLSGVVDDVGRVERVVAVEQQSQQDGGDEHQVEAAEPGASQFSGGIDRLRGRQGTPASRAPRCDLGTETSTHFESEEDLASRIPLWRNRRSDRWTTRCSWCSCWPSTGRYACPRW